MNNIIDNIDNMNNIDKILYEDIIINILNKENDFQNILDINNNYIINKCLTDLIQIINNYSYILYDKNDLTYLIMHLSNSININNNIINILKDENIDNEIKLEQINNEKKIIDIEYNKLLMLSISNYINN